MDNSSKNGTFRAINQDKKTDVRITLEHKGDKSRSVTRPPVLFITKEAGVTKEQLKEMIDEYDEEYKDVKGFSHILLNIKMIIWLKKQH